MKAMILAAGRGERMGELTAQRPKPLIPIGGKPMIDYTLARLSAARVREIVINIAYLGSQIETHLGSGDAHGVSITYSREPDGALETGGGIAAALPLLGSEPFIVVNADIMTNFDFSQLRRPQGLGHLVMVPNPPHNLSGDFSLVNGNIAEEGDNMATFSGIGVYSPVLFEGHSGRFPLAPLLKKAMRRDAMSGELFRGTWIDVGTPERLAQARRCAPALDVQQP